MKPKKLLLMSAFIAASFNSCDMFVQYPERNEPNQEQPVNNEEQIVLNDINFNYLISNQTSEEKLLIYTTQNQHNNGFTTLRLNHSEEMYSNSISARAFSTNYYNDTINSTQHFFGLFPESVIDIENGVYNFEAIVNSNTLEALLVIEKNNDLLNNFDYQQNQNVLSQNNSGRTSIYVDNGTDPFIATNLENEINILDYAKFVQKDSNGLYFNSQIFNNNGTNYSDTKIRFNLESRLRNEDLVIDYDSGDITPTIRIGNENTDILTLAQATKNSIYGAIIQNGQATVNYVLNPLGNGIIPESDIFLDNTDGYLTFIAPIGQYSIDGTSTFSIDNFNDAQQLNNPNIVSLRRYNF